MKTNRTRHHPVTIDLFSYEAALKKHFEKEEWNEIKLVADLMKQKLHDLEQAGISNSRALDRFLQVAMAWITTFLGGKTKTKEPPFRATVSLFARQQVAILVKPCLVYPGRCQTPQPTISVGGTEGPRGWRGRLGQTWLAMSKGKILYCELANRKCDQYITLGGTDETKSAVCIPLAGSLENLRANLNLAGSECSLREFCPPLEATKSKDYVPKLPDEDRIVLNIECLSDYLSPGIAQELLTQDQEFEEVIELLLKTVAHYQKHREVHRALELCSTLLALSTNTLTPRPAYRALLREISAVCDGADVTLHLRDLFADEDKDRCSLTVAGVGRNFRGFLVNERIGLNDGQIGRTLERDDEINLPQTHSNCLIKIKRDMGEKEVRVRYICGQEIQNSLEGKKGALPFKQLMPNTYLNVTVPICFHDIKMGVINIEWDKDTLIEAFKTTALTQADVSDADSLREISDETQIEKYLSECLPVVYRMADYLSLVIDYFDDQDHLIGSLREKLRSDSAEKNHSFEQLTSHSALRKVMRYYMEEALSKVRKGETNNNEPQLAVDFPVSDQAVLINEQARLKDMVDAVGYFLASKGKLRILVSIRRLIGDMLIPHVSHWVVGDKKYEEKRKAGIPLTELNSVLATSARHGVPLFGTIDDSEEQTWKLRLNNLWRKLVIPHEQNNMPPDDSVPYLEAGNNPCYEVGIPLVFGRDVLGTFDVEQFAHDATTVDPDELGLDEPRLCSHLEWGRAITFLIAAVNDQAQPPVNRRRKPFERFTDLCAQWIAEVPVPNEQMVAIASDLFGSIAPIEDAQLVPSLPIDLPADRKLSLLQFRGDIVQGLSWLISSRRALLNSQWEAAERKPIAAMMSSYFSLFLNLPRQRPPEGDFIRCVGQIQADIEREYADLIDPARDAGEAVQNVFRFLHQSLHRHLANQAKETENNPRSSKYAWFLHMRHYDRRTGNDKYKCDLDVPGEPRKMLAYCFTTEMVEILKETLKKIDESVDQSPAEVLLQVIKHRSTSREEISNDDQKAQEWVTYERLIRDGLTASPRRPTYQQLFDVLTTCLARPKVDEEGARSFTLTVARVGYPIVVPEKSLSPQGFEREHGWFWDSTYTVLGIPFKLNNKCVAVLNVFRRRESDSDMEFFRIEERDEAGKLAESVNDLLDRLTKSETVDKIEVVQLCHDLTKLRDELAKRVAGEAKLIVITSPFAAAEESFDVLCGALFGEHAPPALQHPVIFPSQEESVVKRTVVTRLGHKPPAQLLEDLRVVAKHATQILLFIPTQDRPETPVYAGIVPPTKVDYSLVDRDYGQEKLYSKWVLGESVTRASVSGKPATDTSKSDLAGNETSPVSVTAMNMLCRRELPTDVRSGAPDKQKWIQPNFIKWLSDHQDEAVAHLQQATWRPTPQSFVLRRWRDSTSPGRKSGD